MVGEVPGPPGATDKVTVKVRYAGVGFADVMALRGGYPLAPRQPFSPGYEFFGETDGQPVAGIVPSMGCYRETLVVDPAWVVPVPGGVEPETAAQVPLNYLTALAMVDRLAALKPGQSLWVLGAAGGVGTAVLEVARLRGVRAFGTAAEAKHPLVVSLGATPLSRGALPPEKVDAVFDAFGVQSFRHSWRGLGPRGTLVAYGMSPDGDGGTGRFLAGALYLAGRMVLGGGRAVKICSAPLMIRSDPRWYRESLAMVLGWAAEGKIRPTLGGILPWNQVVEAHRRLAAGEVRGKLLLEFP